MYYKIYGMRKFAVVLLLLQVSFSARAQNKFNALILNGSGSDTLAGVSAVVKNTGINSTGDTQGFIRFGNIPSGRQTITFSYVGYKPLNLSLSFPLNNPDSVYKISLAPDEQTLEEVIISSTRTNSRIENLPVKVEVLGQEEMGEENMIKPSNIASILGDLSVLHVQQTSATTGNTTIRMEGLDGKYTQILRDGLPLYEGFSGNFGILSIPPLDLKQVEIIKGSVSTLYGGGAIAGMINLISKTPGQTRDLSFTLNRSTLKENNINGYYSQRFGRFGLTFLAQQTLQNAVDVNADHFSDVPKLNSTVIHPRLFYYISDKSSVDFGYSFTGDNRIGGDIDGITTGTGAAYFERNKSYRNSLDFHYKNRSTENNTLTAKGSLSSFLQTSSEPGILFKGLQYTNYFEVSNLLKLKSRELVVGTNYQGEYFRKQSGTVLFTDYTYHTIGVFVQDDWHLTSKLLLETGIRVDHHNEYGTFFLPRIAFLLKPNEAFSVRLSSGLGYKTPELFTSETLTRNLQHLLPLKKTLSTERSIGTNIDANYHVLLGSNFTLDIDQAFYYTRINHPITATVLPDETISLENAAYYINSLGTDTYFRLSYQTLEFYLGYNHTIARENQTEKKVYLPFSPQDKFSTTLAYSIEGKWRFGAESSFVASQYIVDNVRVKNYLFLAGMVERKFGERFSFVLNCENLTDVRQSKYEALYTGTRANPTFRDLWAPIDGRVVNLAMRVKI